MAVILVIDDDDTVRGLIKKVLLTAGHEVFEASNGALALRTRWEQPLDLILTDIFMPGKEGLETIREFKRQQPAIPIIAMSGGITAMDSSATLLLAKTLGADRTIPKPISKEELLAIVNSLMPGE